MDRYEGFREFLLARGQALSRTAYLLTGDHHRAEELLQSALVRTAPHWRRVAEGGNPEAYVRRVMINERNTWWRRRSPLPAPVPEHDGGRDESADVAERVTMIAVLAALPPRQRAIIVLRFYHDYSVADTADAIGCAVGTLKGR